MKDEYACQEVLHQIEKNLNHMLESSKYFNSNFIACLLEIAIKHSRNFQLNIGLVSAACLNSSQQSLGIVLLENYLIINGERKKPPKHDGASSSKKPKTSLKNDASRSEDLHLWIELAKLYRSINDHDSLKGIFTHKLDSVTKYTQLAFEYEANCDFVSARDCYKDALDDADVSAIEIEQELWEQSLLRCCNELTDWNTMYKCSMRDTSLNELFNDAYSLDYVFPYAFRSNLKLLIDRKDSEEKKQALSQQISDFITVLDKDNKKFFEQSYSQELAMFYLSQSDLNASQYYAQMALEKYFEEWSTMNKTVVSNRMKKLKSLQAIIELNEFVKFVDKHQMYDDGIEAKVNRLVDMWMNTMPNAFSDPPSTWDDVISNRFVYLDFIEAKYFGEESSVDECERRKGVLEKMKTVRVDMQLKFANSAEIQANHRLALRKLEKSAFVLKNESGEWDHLKVTWMNCYLKTHLNSAKKMSDADEALKSIVKASTLNRFAEFEKMSRNVGRELYHEHKIIHCEYVRFVFDALTSISTGGGGSSDVFTNEKKLCEPLSGFIGCDDWINGSAINIQKVFYSIFKNKAFFIKKGFIS